MYYTKQVADDDYDGVEDDGNHKHLYHAYYLPITVLSTLQTEINLHKDPF